MPPPANDPSPPDSERPANEDDAEPFPAVPLPEDFESALELIAKMRVEIAKLRQEREDIEVEEKRMFEFLHGLGEALTSETAASLRSLHRIIVQGISMVVEASGGALYLLDDSGQTLVPRYLSTSCPPLLPIPQKVRSQMAKNPNAIVSYLGLTSIPRDKSFIGQALTTGEPIKIDRLGEHPEFGEGVAEFRRDVTALVAPLLYGDKELGVVAVGHATRGNTFTKNDYDVFVSAAEQSAFTLGNAIAHKEATKNRKLEKEIRTARDVQKILLPGSDPKIPGYNIAGTNIPASLVSGDYFDFIEVDENHLGIVIADVSGKGIGASLIMAMCRSVIRANAAYNHSPANVLRAANRQLFPDIREDMFISLAYAILDLRSGELLLARAGHDPPLHFIKETGEIRPVKPKGIAIGIDDGEVFDRAIAVETIQLEPGDTFLLYTDGVNEALDVEGEEYGMDALLEVFRAQSSKTSAGLVESITSEIRGFAGSAAQNDDITLIAVQKQ
ncbi:MAG: sigma-B regulation protein RsbU (phosphoserine phosphatase) [Verrucomicrobiales bacterium]|jgi:sigma-B regulation protein RsbU (phosphoserine phosphatase)